MGIKGILTRREFLQVTSVTSVGAFLAACAAPVAPSTGGAEGAQEATPTKLQGTIIVSLRDTSNEDGSIMKAGQDALVAAYNEHQPDVEVIFEAPPPGGIAGGYGPWLTTQLAAGDVRQDIVSGTDAGTYRNYLNFDRYRSAINPYAGKPWDQEFNFDRFKWANAKGERIGLAAAAAEVFWYANKTILDSVGAAIPTTWTEFIDACEKAAAVVPRPITINWAWQANQWMSGVYFDQYHLDWVEAVRAHEGDWCYDPEFDGNFVYDAADKDIHSKYTYNAQRYYRGIREGELRFDTPAFAEMIDNLSMAWPTYAQEDMFVAAGGEYALWLQQQAVFMPSGTWALVPIERDMQEVTVERLEQLKLDANTTIEPFEWAIFPMPSMEGSLVQTKAKDVAGQGDAYVSIITKDQEQIDRCVDFVMFWYSQPGMQTYYDARMEAGWSGMGAVDVRGVNYPPEVQALVDRVVPAGNAELNQNNWVYFGGTESSDNTHVVNVKNKYKEALERTINGEEFAAWLQEYWETNFDDIITMKGLAQTDLDNPAREPGT